MWSSILSNIIISVFIVMILHFTWDYIKNTYFKKYSKTKDLVNIQLQKYKNIIEELQKEKTERTEETPMDMEKDLEQFMNEIDT
jgi:hypothetical protein